MELSQRVDELEAEIKVVKNEVQSVLLDIRERVLSYYDNPFQVIEARSGGNKGDVDASIIGGGGGDSASPAPAPAPAPVAPAAVEQRPPEMAMGGEFSEGTRKMEESSNQLKAMADQMQLERQAMEQERRALDQARQAASQAAQAQMAAPEQYGMGMPGQQAPGMPGQFGSGMPGQQAPGMPGQFGPGMPGQFGSGMPGQFGQAMQTMPGYGSPQQMGQQPMQQAAASLMPQQPMQGSDPVHHKHIHQKERVDDYRERADDYDEDGEYDDVRESQHPRQGTREGRRRPSSGGGQGVHPSRRTPMERDRTREDEERKPARRVISGKRRQWDYWSTEEESAEDQTEVNLMTLIGLVRWVEKSIKKIGKEKVEAIVEIYRTAGYLPSSYKDTIPQIILLADDEKPEGSVSMGDSISVLLQLDGLLGGKFKTESAVLSTLFGDDGDYPWTKQ
ncbi:hypothetical protein ACFLU3_01630 [Chloroflexota bacterium]